MGKSKRRILHKGINNQITNLKREDALNDVVKAFNAKKINDDIKDLISLFGFSAEELLETGASTIALNCPFCMTMLTDGIKAKEKEESIKVKDISEILLEFVED